MGKYADALDSIDPLGRQNRIKRQLERAIREERAAKRTRFADLGDDYTMTPEGPQETAPLPLPDGLTVTAGMERIDFVWSGSASAPLPADFDRLSLHASKISGYIPTQGTEVAAIATPVGGFASYEADPNAPYYIRAAVVSLRGDYGPFTDEVEVIPQELSIDGAVVWNPHSFRIANTQSMPHNAYAQVTSWTDTELDTVTTAAASVTVTVPGIYFTGAQLAYVPNGTGRRGVRVIKNADTTNPVATAATSADPGGGASTFVSCFALHRYAAGDVLTVEGYQSSGAALDLSVGASRSNFTLYRVSL